MRFFYYPGCSLEGAADEYDISTRSLMRALGIELVEIEDWTCCGASVGNSIGPILSMALPARNLALAERAAGGAGTDILAPCSACYLNLKKANERIRQDRQAYADVNTVLKEERLNYTGSLRVRHLLDVLINDVGGETLASRVKTALSGIRVAPYYGCQVLRPFTDFDDPERPEKMEPLIEALGADVHRWAWGGRCCGAGLITTKKELALELAGAILEGARGADCIVTICPMCRMNLESYQKTISRQRGVDLSMTILYLPQLIGLGLGLEMHELSPERSFLRHAPFMDKPWRLSA